MHMRTTLDLPEELLKEAQRLTASPTKRQTVVTALEELVRAKRRKRLIARLGRKKLNISPEDLAEMRQGREPPGPDEPLRLIMPSEGQHRCPPKHTLTSNDQS